MKIGIDALFLRPQQVGGTESYLRNLLKGFSLFDRENEYFIFTSTNNYSTFEFNTSNFHLIKCDVDNSNRVKRLYYQNVHLPKQIKKIRLDLMFFPTYTRCLDNLDGLKVVSNIHDLQYKHFPKYFSFSKKVIFKIFYPMSIKKSDYLISISDFVKEDITQHFGQKYSNKIKTIYNPIDFDEIRRVEAPEEHLEHLGINPKKYILSIASLIPHKNIATLVKAFSFFINQVKDYKLVLAGIKDKSTNEITRLIKELKMENKVIVPGFISNKVLAILYQNAGLFVSPSLFEGFGMPPVEAMYNKIPVIATRKASLPEVTMGKAFYYEPAKDFKALFQKMLEVIKNYPSDEELDKLAKEVYQRYNLRKITQEYVDFFKRAVNQ